MQITENGYLLTQEEYDEYQYLKAQNKFNSLGIKKKENISTYISPYQTPKSLQNIEKFFNTLK